MMTRKQPLPFLGLALATLVGCSVLAGTPLQAQDDDRGRRVLEDPPRDQRLFDEDEDEDDPEGTQQQPRRRSPASEQQEDDRQRDGRQLDRPNARVLPPGPGWDGPRWLLGVTTQSTSSGVRVRSVLPGSPASRAGLERDDVIVTVDGFQVGRVGPRHYPLGEELQFRAGRRGDVLLLVQNWRNDRLVNLPVQLTRRARFDDWPRRRHRGDGGFEPRQQDNETDRRSAEEAPIE